MNHLQTYFMNIKHHIQLIKTTLRFGWLALMLCGGLQVHAQGWENYYGTSNDDERANGVLELIDEGYVFAGYSNGSEATGGYDLYVLRTDVDGEVLWDASFGGETNEFGNSITLASDGGFVIVGESNGGGQFGMRDVLLIKIDSLGNQVWEKSFGGSNDDRGFQRRHSD